MPARCPRSLGGLSRILARFAAVAWLAAALGSPAHAQPQPAGHHVEQTFERAPVQLDGATLFQVRGSPTYPAALRAAAIATQIEGVARDPKIDAASVHTGTVEGVKAILAGTTLIMVVTKADADIEGVAVDTLSYLLESRVRSAVQDYRDARSTPRLLRAGLLAVGATMAYLAAIGLTLWSSRRIGHTVERSVLSNVRTVGIQSFALLRAERISVVVLALLKLLRVVAFVSLTLAWLVFLLGLFPWSARVGHGLLDAALEPLAVVGKSALAAAPNLIFLGILYFAVRLLLRVVRLFFEAVDRGAVTLMHFEAEWAMPTYKLARLALIVLGLVVAYPYVPGSDSPAFKGMSVFLGVVFSLGSSTAVSNIIAGYLMTYRRAFRVGDRVQIGDIVGKVTETRLQVTHLRTPKHEEVVIPNAQIINGHVVNFSTLARDDGLLVHTKVGIGYDTPWRQVEAMLLEAARRTPGIAANPPAFVLQTALGDFAITYELNVGCNDPHRMERLSSGLHQNILDVFNEYGVAIMTPAYEGDPEEPKLVSKDKWFLSPAQPARDAFPAEAARAPESGASPPRSAHA